MGKLRGWGEEGIGVGDQVGLRCFEGRFVGGFVFNFVSQFNIITITIVHRMEK